VRRIGFNPLPWYLTTDGLDPTRAPSLPEILRTIKAAGYDGVPAEMPASFTARQYQELLAEHGLTAAPGHFQASFSDLAAVAITIDDAKEVAAQHAALGLDRVFIVDGAAACRVSQPAQGVNADPGRLSIIVEVLDKVCTAMAGEGVIPCLHPHVGTWIETGAETEGILAALSPSVLKFGPDTGHLAWAGVDSVAFIRSHVDRVGAVHIKDIRKTVADSVKREDGGYREACERHIWTEPGRGDVDLAAVLAALDTFDGWFIVEVDIADQPTVEQSAKVAADWLRSRLHARGA